MLTKLDNTAEACNIEKNILIEFKQITLVMLWYEQKLIKELKHVKNQLNIKGVGTLSDTYNELLTEVNSSILMVYYFQQINSNIKLPIYFMSEFGWS